MEKYQETNFLKRVKLHLEYMRFVKINTIKIINGMNVSFVPYTDYEEYRREQIFLARLEEKRNNRRNRQ